MKVAYDTVEMVSVKDMKIVMKEKITESLDTHVAHDVISDDL